MIRMLARAQKSWIAKAILTLTALSFMSLFGISGYLSSAGKNKPVIKVDNVELKQSEFQYMLQRESAKLRNLLGEAYDEDENIHNDLIQKIASRELMNAIIDRTSAKHNISVSDELIQYGIISQPEFQINGMFQPKLLKTFLSQAGISEAEYIMQIRRNIEKQILLGAALDDFRTPAVLTALYTKLSGQKRVFDYVTVDLNKIKADRKISDDEVEQYYEDFAPDFIEPERRDAEFILISNADIEKSITVSDEEIDAYYQDNISDYETPETRAVLQMMFDDETEANKAFFALKSGQDFYAVAENSLQQTHDETNFGEVSKDMLIAEVQDAVFALHLNEVTAPIQSENGWHIMKVEKITPMHKMPKDKARADIISKIKAEKLYDEMYGFIAKVEDEFGAGKSISEVAKGLGASVYNVGKLAEDGSYYHQSPKNIENIVKTPDFIDAVFSYNVNEPSQAVETEQGFVIVNVTEIYDSHPKSIEEVRPQIEKMWEENERSVIAQEIVNDVMHYLEEGEKMQDVANRFNLKLVKTSPVSRGESFGELNTDDVLSLFQEDLYTPKLLTKGSKQIVAIAESSTNEDRKLSADEAALLQKQVNYSYVSDLANRLLNDFARGYDVRVKYRLMGLQD